jgi:hypothetical protein
MHDRAGGKQLVNELTLVDGKELPKIPEREIHFWATLPEWQKPIHLVPQAGKRLPQGAQGE